MHHPSTRAPGQTPCLQAGRVGLAAFLFAFLQPAYAKSAVTNTDSLTLFFAS